jgi:hypothetical protein
MPNLLTRTHTWPDISHLQEDQASASQYLEAQASSREDREQWFLKRLTHHSIGGRTTSQMRREIFIATLLKTTSVRKAIRLDSRFTLITIIGQ